MIHLLASLHNPADPHANLCLVGLGWGEFNAKFPGLLNGAIYNGQMKSYIVPLYLWPDLAREINSGHKDEITLDIDVYLANWEYHERQKKDELSHLAESRIREFNAKLVKRGMALREYQKAGVLWLCIARGGILADQMGLGKTIQVLCALPETSGSLIICPTGLRHYWIEELTKWRPDLIGVLVEKKSDFRWPASILGRPEVVITSDTCIPADLPSNMPREIYLAADECQAYKNESSQRTKRMMNLTSQIRANAGWTVGISATPLMKDPKDLYTLTEVFGVNRLAWGSWSEFCELWGGVDDPFTKRYYWSTQPNPEIKKRFARVSLRRLQKDVLPDLPSLSHKTIPIELPRRISSELDKFKDRLERELYEWEFYNVMPTFKDFAKVKTELAALKYEYAKTLVEEYESNEEQVLVFSDHLAAIEQLAKRDQWALMSGNVSAKDRQGIVDKFQANKFKGLAMSIKAGGVGFNLTNASQVLFIDLPYDPSLVAQAIARAWRSGQKNPVLATYLVGNHPLEKRIHAILMKKQAYADKLY